MSKRSLEDLKRDLEQDFKIDDYLELRERFPDEDFFTTIICPDDPNVGSLRGIDYACMLDKELKKFGIDTENFAAMLDGQEERIDLLCLQILAALSQRQSVTQNLRHAVANSEVIGDALVDFLISAIVEHIGCYGLFVPCSLQALIKVRLNVYSSQYIEEAKNKDRRSLAAAIWAQFPEMGVREIALEVGVNASTVSRWNKTEKFQRTVNAFKYGLKGKPTSKQPPKSDAQT